MSDIQRDREERQHVIEVLKSWDGYFIGYTSDEVQEALRYAIASIKTDLKYDLLYEETSGQADKPTTKNDLEVDVPDNNVGNIDCISREQAKAAIRNRFKDLPSRVEINTILNELPSVTPQEPRWIPVSEKLPEPFMYVNATCRSLIDDRENWVVETIYLPIPKEVNKHGYSDWGNIPMLNWGKAEVIAWVERIIPQPYKGENEE